LLPAIGKVNSHLNAARAQSTKETCPKVKQG
jgi:hypothetical protein